MPGLRQVHDLGAEAVSHPLNLFDGDMMFREFQQHMAVNLDRLETLAIPVQAVAIREDLWPGMIDWHGYPVVRLTASSALPWGVVT